MSDLDAMTPLDDDFIDRIVDGTMTPAELRAAVLRLDRHADGWKQCAIAFLEAQCWRASFRALDPPAKNDVEARTLTLPAAAPSRIWPRWQRSAAAAGLIAGAFVLGWLGHLRADRASVIQSRHCAARLGARADPTRGQTRTRAAARDWSAGIHVAGSSRGERRP